MENHLDSESYWNRSTSKAFSFDDEVDDVDCMTDVNYGCNGILQDGNISEASFENSSENSNALNLSIKSVVSDNKLKLILQEQTLDDRIISKSVTPEEELKQLRRQIQATLYDPSSEATVQKLLHGKSAHLEVFKSLHEKQDLLNTVLKCGGGDAVIGVVLFLKKTLNAANFYKILQQQPKVLEYYISYLKQRHSHEALELLQRFNKLQELTLINFQNIFSCNELASRKAKLWKLIESNDGNGEAAVGNGVFKQILLSAYKLLDLIETEGAALGDCVNVDSTAVEVLYACCSKHNNWKDHEGVRVLSPYRLCAEHQISAGQMEWTALHERARAKAFGDLEHVFERSSTWHPMKRRIFHISFPLYLAIVRLHELDAPSSVLYPLLSKIDNATEKLHLAQNMNCIKAIIDAMTSLKDIAQLTKFRSTLTERTEEAFYCDKALRGLHTKRWNPDNMRLRL